MDRLRHNLDAKPNNLAKAQETGRCFAGAILEAAQIPPEQRIHRWPRWREYPEARATVETTLAKRRAARRLFKDHRARIIWKSLRTAFKGMRTAIDAGGSGKAQQRARHARLVQTPQGFSGPWREAIGWTALHRE